FDLDEKLTGVAFMDVGVYVTSLRPLKNLLLIGDVVKSVWFVAFQVSQLSFAVSDDLGVLRIYEFNPHHPESNNGARLICQSEFNTHVPHTSALVVSQKSEASPDPDAVDMQTSGMASCLVISASDGSVSALTPLDQTQFGRLHLLQGQLIRNIQHVAGLNPKGHLYVRNDNVSRALSNGILDGDLLAAFEELPVAKQIEMPQQIGAERDKIISDLLRLRKPW
ncbi:mRNA cleavage and polyadenylation factor subunit, partial [Ceratobasidium sp. 370]